MPDDGPLPGAKPASALARWLGSLCHSAQQHDGPLLIGGTGHILLSAEEEISTDVQLTQRVLPQIYPQIGQRPVLLLSGAAPGADIAFTRTARRWLTERGVHCEVVAVLPVSVSWLVEDWITRAQAEGLALGDGARHQRYELLAASVAEADHRVPLYEPEHEREMISQAWREEQYRRLAACLAEQSDILIAVLRAQNLREPGGTADVVEWRRHLDRIPPRLSTRGVKQRHADGARHPLFVIDPSVRIDSGAQTGGGAPADELQAVERCAEDAMRSGNDLLCHDILCRAQQQGMRSRRIEYLQILSLANAGSTDLALEQYRGLHLPREEMHEDWLALQGRLHKSLALAGGGSDARRHFHDAALAYLDAFRRCSGSYSGINAASMYQLSGRREAARALAGEVLAQLRTETGGDEVHRYYLAVTEAEAALLLGDLARCRSCLQRANAWLGDDINRRSSTLRQLRRLCQELDLDASLLDPLELPPVVLLRRTGEAGAAAAEAAAASSALALVPRGALAHLGLRDPGDLLLAEQLAASGARLYLTLPDRQADLRNAWSRSYGDGMLARLDTVLQSAEDISAVSGFLDEEARWRSRQICMTAMGLSLACARRLGTRWRRIEYCISDGLAEVSASEELALSDVAMPAVPAALLAQARLDADTPAGRRMVGILFADFVGYRRIPDEQLPRFWDELIGSLAHLVDRHGERVLLRSSWGDALHVITADALSAAQLAVEVQQFMDRERRAQRGLLSDLELRIAVHFAPAFEGHDPIRRQPVFYGSQLSFAARIEPIAPPGLIFGSEAFTARLMLEAPGEFFAQYAGEIELAKRFGRYRLFAIRRHAEAPTAD